MTTTPTNPKPVAPKKKYRIGTGTVSQDDHRPALLIWPHHKGGFFPIPLAEARDFADAIVDAAEAYEQDPRVQIDPDGVISSLAGMTEQEAFKTLLRRLYNDRQPREDDPADLPESL